jgi:hypothetical protein
MRVLKGQVFPGQSVCIRKNQRVQVGAQTRIGAVQEFKKLKHEVCGVLARVGGQGAWVHMPQGELLFSPWKSVFVRRGKRKVSLRVV